jgi:hypothetical protein
VCNDRISSDAVYRNSATLLLREFCLVLLVLYTYVFATPQVYDADMAKMETFLGRCTIDVARLPANEKKPFKLALRDVPTGSISVVCEYIPLGSDRPVGTGGPTEGPRAEESDSDSDCCEGDVLYDAYPDELGNATLLGDDLQDHLLDEDQDHSGVWSWSAPQSTVPIPIRGAEPSANASAGGSANAEGNGSANMSAFTTAATTPAKKTATGKIAFLLVSWQLRPACCYHRHQVYGTSSQIVMSTGRPCIPCTVCSCLLCCCSHISATLHYTGNGTSTPAAAQGTPQDSARTPAPSSTPSQPHSQPQRRPSAGSTSSLFSKHLHHGIGGNSSGALQVSGIRLRNMKYRGTGLFGGLVGCFVQCSVNNFVKRTKAETVSCRRCCTLRISLLRCGFGEGAVFVQLTGRSKNHAYTVAQHAAVITSCIPCYL